VKGAATRTLATAFTLRAMLLMTLMPGAGYGEVMTALAGDLAVVPWAGPWQVPSETVLSTWRTRSARSRWKPSATGFWRLPGARRRPGRPQTTRKGLRCPECECDRLPG
jgi:hypothetical protein